jgi:hypothetical protein
MALCMGVMRIGAMPSQLGDAHPVFLLESGVPPKLGEFREQLEALNERICISEN